MTKFQVLMGAIVMAFGGVLLLAALLAFPTKWCWNYAAVPLFHVREIGAMEAWCLTFLGGAFFKANVTLKCKHDE